MSPIEASILLLLLEKIRKIMLLFAKTLSLSLSVLSACDCNGNADRCYFDADLYQRTGHGGHCLDCRDNTDGPNCERCKVNHYHHVDTNRCVPCGCDPIGNVAIPCI